MSECIFCSIIARKTPGRIVFEDNLVVAIEDIRPQAPVHLLVMPRAHVDSLNDLKPEDESLLRRLFIVAAGLARERGLATKGYRTALQNGAWSGKAARP